MAEALGLGAFLRAMWAPRAPRRRPHDGVLGAMRGARVRAARDLVGLPAHGGVVPGVHDVRPHRPSQGQDGAAGVAGFAARPRHSLSRPPVRGVPLDALGEVDAACHGRRRRPAVADLVSGSCPRARALGATAWRSPPQRRAQHHPSIGRGATGTSSAFESSWWAGVRAAAPIAMGREWTTSQKHTTSNFRTSVESFIRGGWPRRRRSTRHLRDRLACDKEFGGEGTARGCGERWMTG